MTSPVGPKCTNISRLTKEGRKLTYQLQVIQQPERARACGSGAKSSADRRPVDPPPVVELRIFEGENMTDVTFSHNANFFLYATLEAARPIASGRVPQPTTSFPVLTGFPVSSMAYLDRPTPAGYFIFPDLSVRHEGKYKLAFNLYEEVKEAKDADVEPAANPSDRQASQPLAPQEHYHWRLEVQSLPFTVFSAKKFPGLAESTALSRIVAEQGCRVRIRRDVRMRRRENKSNKDYDDFEDVYSNHEGPVEGYRQSSMPNGSERGDRQTSVSALNAHPSTPYEAERRSSMHDQNYYQSYQSGYHGPAPPPPTSAPANSHISFGAPPAQQYPAPQYPAAPPQNQHAPVYGDAQYGYSQSQQQQSQGPASQPYNYDRPSLSNGPQHAQAPSGHGRGESADSKVHEWQQNQQYQAPYQPKPISYSFPQTFPTTYMNNPTPRTPTPGAGSNALPPLKMPLPMEPKYDGVSSPAATALRHHSLPSPGIEVDVTRTNSQGPFDGAARTSKRPFGSVFESAHYDQSLANGSRPSEAHHGADLSQPAYDEDEYDSAYDMSQLKMHYKRADGTEISRRLTTAR